MRDDIPDLAQLADELVTDVASSDLDLDAVGTFASWQDRLTVDDYQTLAILLARRVAER